MSTMPEQLDINREVTELAQRWGQGRSAVKNLTPSIYKELRQLARSLIAQRDRNHGLTLDATGIANEVYMILKDGQWEDRGHFLATAARSIRRVLIDHARRRNAIKRRARRVPLDECVGAAGKEAGSEFWRTQELLALDDALHHLEREDARLTKVVELRFFARLTWSEVAEVLGVSVRTAQCDWTLARAKLRLAMSQHSTAREATHGQA